MSDDLDVIAPAATSATFNGREIQIKPLKVGQLPAFARAIKPLGGAIEAIATGTAALDVAMLLGMIGDHGESVIEAVAVATGLSRDEINDATPDQLVELVVVVLKVNADFFKGRLTPAILAAVNRVVPATASPGAGPTA